MSSMKLLLSVCAVAVLIMGCSVPGTERKFGRGVANATEFARLGELRRSMEQSIVLRNPEVGYTTGFFHGINRSIARTGAGIYEMATAPLPNDWKTKDYGPIFHPEGVVYPDSYRPNWIADEFVSPDASLGFAGGDVMPFLPGSRFRIFDN
jgi:putative exosortase-associated protein (TIGR04073 family)